MDLSNQAPEAHTRISQLMQQALSEAQLAAQQGEVPVGAVVADEAGRIIGRAHNRVEELRDPLAHAEMLAVRQALTAVGDKHLSGCTVAVTLEPCPMCMAALCHARVARVVFGAYDPKSGGTVNGPRVVDFMHHKPEILGGICEEPCSALLKDFFAGLRQP